MLVENVLDTSKNSLVGNFEANIAVCCLWQEVGPFATLLSERDLLDKILLGPLCNPDLGLAEMLRSLLAMPNFRYLIVCGVDLSLGRRAGQCLIDFFERGCNAVEAEIANSGLPASDLEELRHNLCLIDLRVGQPLPTGLELSAAVCSAKPEFIANLLGKVVPTLPKLPAWSQPRYFEKPVPHLPQNLPSEGAGFHVTGRTVADVWLELQKYCLQFGNRKPTEYAGQEQLELAAVTSVINGERIEKPHLPAWLGVNKSALTAYYPQVLTDLQVPGVAYTYGQLLNRYGQLDKFVEKLNENWFTRRACAVTWDAEKHLDSGNPPCLIAVTASIQDNRLQISALFRSQDIRKAYAQNAFALFKLQQEICNRIGNDLKPAALTIFTQSLHLYSSDWERARATLAEHYQPHQFRWQEDPRGYVLIELDRTTKEIILKHGAQGRGLLHEHRAKTPADCEAWVKNNAISQDVGHLLYLGRMFFYAWFCLETGAAFEQDRIVLNNVNC